MSSAVLIPMLIGAIGILQGSINRQMSNEVGLSTALVFGNVITLVISIVFYYLVYISPNSYPSFFLPRSITNNFQWWYLLPGLFGFVIITALPYAIFKLGAVQVTLFLITAQIVTSCFWDVIVEKITVSPNKIIGIILAIMSVAISSWKN
ncbi:DMT family transporter [Bacteriovoracaceae bacterium]|nr:DMT family transporter [Bacteriovoracaceae bacterium]|tara:strand:- start:50806 stop:51255 length:450 start_codon:yes stop_codon:yes gene_type:complete